MVDHFLDFVIWNRTIQNNRIPMFFVHVVAGYHCIIMLPQDDGPVGIAFQVHRDGNRLDVGQGKQLV